jgi:L-ribulose-5-phosphate 3-epimerase
MLLKSINYWSFPGGLESTLCPFDAMELAKKHGYDAIELCLGDGPEMALDTTEEFCAKLVQESKDLNLPIASVASGTYWARSLGDSDPVIRQRAKEDLERMIQITAWLGAKTLLTIPGAVDVFFLPDRPKQPYQDVYRYAAEGLRAVLPTAERHQVRLGIENVWNKFLLSPHEMADFIDQFDSPWIGAYVDVANLMPYGHPADWLRTLGNRVVGIHFKDFRRSVGTADGFVDLLEGDVPWPEVMAAIAEIGYSGPVAAEMIPGYAHYPMVRVANASNAMDAILGRSV